MDAVNPAAVRYIKLGEAGGWQNVALDRGEIHFGFAMVPHKLAMTGNREAIKRHLVSQGRSLRAAADDVREIMDFYTLGPDCLWFTFARGQLWWARADLPVHWLGGDGRSHGIRMRKTVDGWHNTDVGGRLLQIDQLSTRLTKAQAYRRTICATDAQDYLLRRIQGIEEPIVARARSATDSLVEVTTEAIASLHWADFEALVDLVFARSGWHRTSAAGGTQETVDIVLEQLSTGEQAMVQVKSTADHQTLDDYIRRFNEAGIYDRLFFVCHSPTTNLMMAASKTVHVWAGPEFARTVIRLGLQDWVFQRVG